MPGKARMRGRAVPMPYWRVPEPRLDELEEFAAAFLEKFQSLLQFFFRDFTGFANDFDALIMVNLHFRTNI